MNIKKTLCAVFIFFLFSIISGCGLRNLLEPTQPISLITYTIPANETLTLTEPPIPSTVTSTATLDPWRYCYATPVSVFVEGFPNTSQAQAVIETIQRARAVEIEAYRTLDSSKFSTVFINDPRFPVSPDVLETVRRLGQNPNLKSAGWLDYKLTFFNWKREQMIPLLTEEALHTPAPTRIIPPDFVWCSPPTALNFLSLDVDADIATVVIKDCGTYELTLVLVDNRWFIAAYKGIIQCYP